MTRERSEHAWRVALRERWLARRERRLAQRHREARERVHDEEHALAPIAEVLGDRRRCERGADADEGRGVARRRDDDAAGQAIAVTQYVRDEVADLAATLAPFRNLIRQYEHTHDTSSSDLAAALAYMAQGETPLMNETPAPRHRFEDRDPKRAHPREERAGESPAERPRRPRRGPEPGMQTYRIEVGHQHGVKPANIVGAIANEAEMSSQHIGRIEIFDDHSLVDNDSRRTVLTALGEFLNKHIGPKP